MESEEGTQSQKKERKVKNLPRKWNQKWNDQEKDRLWIIDSIIVHCICVDQGFVLL